MLFTHHADRAISLVFTNVHPDNPGQKFTITLDVEEVEDRQEWSGENHCLSKLWLLALVEGE